MHPSRLAGASASRRPAEIDRPYVLVASATTSAACPIAQALRDAGYFVRSTSEAADDVCRTLKNQPSVELLVLAGSEQPRPVGAIIDAVRVINWALPIILISRADPALRAEAEHLGVEAILESPAKEEIRRAAKAIVPVVREVEFDLAG
jgi:hypothetical protein